MKVPEAARKCVCFIALPTYSPDGSMTIDRLIGTAFFVGVSSKSIDGISYTYLVTAKHVAEKAGQGPWWVRMNNKSGNYEFIKGTDTKWFFHEDKSVDVALCLIKINFDHMDSMFVVEQIFLTDEIINEKKIGIGDEVYITGLFHKVTGKERNLPIVRMGNVAMMEDEPIEKTKLGPMEAYLVEVRSIGGISGSPVFVYETVNVGIGNTYLMGLVHGHWNIEKNSYDAQGVEESGESINMGIAIVVPTKKIIDILYRPELVALRDEMDKKDEKMLKKMVYDEQQKKLKPT